MVALVVAEKFKNVIFVIFSQPIRSNDPYKQCLDWSGATPLTLPVTRDKCKRKLIYDNILALYSRGLLEA